ncbi:macrophage mannose receptor 1-like [Dicentrarchus labrax]|nr:macrophage mannose receptor 1-like [Dicentrarchus labrax]
MGGVVRLILLLSGLCSLSSCVPQNRYYLFVNTPKTWYEAQSYCREKGFDLATIDNMGEMEIGLKAVEGKYKDAVWIGLQKELTRRWHWSLADKDFYKEGERDYFIPDGTDYSCLTYTKGKPSPAGCPNKKYSVCFDGKKHGREQYVLTNVAMAWTVARDYCRAHHTDLTSVRNELENQIIQEVSRNLTVWIGSFRDPWMWSDQTYSSFRYWKEGKEVWTDDTKNCVAMLESSSGRWGEIPCNEAHPFLCNYAGQVVKFIKVRISSEDSELDLNDPVVYDDILKQVKQDLSNTNVTNLRWRKHPDERVFVKEPNRGG